MQTAFSHTKVHARLSYSPFSSAS